MFKAVIFDWAGTIIDFGSFAPAEAFRQAFANAGIEATIDEARRPMGSPKRDHIAAMFCEPPIRDQWMRKTGKEPDEHDVDLVYRAYLPLNEQAVVEHGQLIPGALDLFEWLNSRDMKIGTTTGYTRSIMEKVLPVVAAQGFEPESLVCSDDLIEGRPGPLGMYQSFINLGVYPPQTVIKVDDTEPGIAEGVASGCITVGVALSGNHAALSLEQYRSMPNDELALIRMRAEEALKAAGADYVIDTVADLRGLIEKLEG